MVQSLMKNAVIAGKILSKMTKKMSNNSKESSLILTSNYKTNTISIKLDKSNITGFFSTKINPTQKDFDNFVEILYHEMLARQKFFEKDDDDRRMQKLARILVVADGFYDSFTPEYSRGC